MDPNTARALLRICEGLQGVVSVAQAVQQEIMSLPGVVEQHRLEQEELLPHRWDLVHQERGVKIGQRRSASPPVSGESFDFEGETYVVVDFQNYKDRLSRVTVQPQT